MKICTRLYIPFLTIPFLILSSCNSGNNTPESAQELSLDNALEICKSYRSVPLDTFDKYSAAALELAAHSTDDYKLSRAVCYRAYYFFNTGQYDAAYLYADSVNKITDISRDTLFIINNADILKGVSLGRLGKYKEGLDWYMEIYPGIAQSKDTIGTVRLDNNIGLLNMDMTRYAEAIRWFQKVVHRPDEEPYLQVKMLAYTNMAQCYSNTYKPDSAILYCKLANELGHKYNNLLVCVNTLNTLGDIYRLQKKYGEAEKSILESIKLREQLEDPFYVVADKLQLATLYTDMGLYNKSIQLSEEAFKLARDNNLHSKYNFVRYALWEAYYKSGHYKQAADVAYEMLVYADSISNTASVQAITEWEVKYETAKKEKKIQEQQFQIKQRNYLITGFLCLLGLSVLLFYFINKNKMNKQKALIREMELDQQKALLQAIIEAEENERSKISVSVHDGLGQFLSVIKMNLQSLSEKVDLNGRASDILSTTQKIVEESIAEMRNLSHQIMPNSVIRKGLVNALKDLVAYIDSNKLRVYLDIDGLQNEIDAEAQLILYRILQECINNVIKHAGADTLSICIYQKDKVLFASIVDNGKGFNVQKINPGGMGLYNIKKRVEYLNGSFNITSAAGQGTTIALSIPS